MDQKMDAPFRSGGKVTVTVKQDENTKIKKKINAENIVRVK
jgi:hypothetical protein